MNIKKQLEPKRLFFIIQKYKKYVDKTVNI